MNKDKLQEIETLRRELTSLGMYENSQLSLKDMRQFREWLLEEKLASKSDTKEVQS